MSRGKWAVAFAGLCVVAAAVAIAYAAGTEAAAPVAEVVRAQRFELVDGKGRVRAAINMGKDGRGPGLTLFDEKGIVRAVLGATDLITPGTGVEEKRPESSVVLFNPEGREMWSAP